MNTIKIDDYRVKPGEKIHLEKWDPNDHRHFDDGGKDEGRELLLKLNSELETLQEMLYAEGKNKVLVVLQAMDAGGKDGTVRHVFEGVNPQGVKVASFKFPTSEELSHDFLWRIHRHTPGSGEIMIFNRSHYEDVLVVRVHEMVSEKTWKRRFDHINNFERMLADEGTTILKFFLHIDLDEQKQRLQERLDRPDKRWKFSTADLEERKLWPKYMKAFEDVLSKTSTDWAPWYIVPSNRKWYRNLVIASAMIKTLRGLDMRYPEPEENLENIIIP